MTAFQLNVKTLYDIEKQLEHVLPAAIEAADNEDLKNSLRSILQETKMHIDRIEKVFGFIDMTPARHEGAGIAGIVKDIVDIVDNEPVGAIKDVMLAGAIRSAEHFKMANYMTSAEEAGNLGLGNAVDVFERTLEEVGYADKKIAIFIKEDLLLIPDEETED